MNSWFEWREAPKSEFGVIGDPVSHSLSPRMQSAAFRSFDLNYRYEALRVPLSELADALDHLKAIGYQGLNVTVPLKFAALDWCKKSDAVQYGAVNTLRLLDRTGTNTDAPGFLSTLRDLNVRKGTALVLGAGGSARALCTALKESGFGIHLWNRTRHRAEALFKDAQLKGKTVDSPDPSGCELIVNMTANGLNNEALSVDWSKAPREALAYDLWYTNGLTPFLKTAQQNGLNVCDGRALLVAQGALSFEWWTGLEAPREAMMNAVK